MKIKVNNLSYTQKADIKLLNLVRETIYEIDFRCTHENIIILHDEWPFATRSVFCYDCKGADLTESEVNKILDGEGVE